MKESVLSGEDVLFHWSMLTTDIEDDKAEILLVMLVDLYITIEASPSPSLSWSYTSKEPKRQLRNQKL